MAKIFVYFGKIGATQCDAERSLQVPARRAHPGLTRAFEGIDQIRERLVQQFAHIPGSQLTHSTADSLKFKYIGKHIS